MMLLEGSNSLFRCYDQLAEEVVSDEAESSTEEQQEASL